MRIVGHQRQELEIWMQQVSFDKSRNYTLQKTKKNLFMYVWFLAQVQIQRIYIAKLENCEKPKYLSKLTLFCFMEKANQASEN